MLIDFYIILFVGAVISLVVSMKTKRLIPGFFSTILFFVLALQGFTIEFITAAGSTVVVSEIVLVYVNYLLGTVSFFVVLLGMVRALKSRSELQQAMRLN